MKFPIDLEDFVDNFKNFAKIVLNAVAITTASMTIGSVIILALTFFVAGTFHPVYPVMFLVRLAIAILWFVGFIICMKLLGRD